MDQTSNTLDLILTDDQTSINKLKYGDPSGSSDHVTIEMEYIIKARLDHNQSSNSKRFALDRGDYQSMKNDLNRIDWDKEFEGMSTNSMMNFFESKLKQASEKFIPQFPADSNPGKERQPSWINHKTLRALKKKHNAYKRWMITKDGRDYQKYKKQRNASKARVRKSILEFEKRIAQSIKKSNKGYWKYANSKLKSKSKVPDLKLSEESYTSNDQEKADILNEFFSSVFTHEDLNNFPKSRTRIFRSKLEDIEITEEIVLDALTSLNGSKSPGPDAIHPRILKECATIIAHPLSLIFKSSLASSELPTQWKLANVTPVFKKGNKHSRENYRPISLTSIVCRLMEKLLKNAIVDHLEKNSLFSNNQWGFRGKRSCASQLLKVFEEVTAYIEEDHCVDIIYFDFAKAFDSVPHERLLRKIESYGIGGNFLK